MREERAAGNMGQSADYSGTEKLFKMLRFCKAIRPIVLTPDFHIDEPPNHTNHTAEVFATLCATPGASWTRSSACRVA